MSSAFYHSDSSQKRFQPARILLIEDDQTVNNTLADVLRPLGYHIQQCFNGREGLSAAINHSFHLILLDKLLPDLDGLDVLQRLRKYKDTPVMMLTACGAEQDRIAGFSGGADDYLPKPFNMTELKLRIEALLRRSMRLNDAQDFRTVAEEGDLKLDAGQLRVSLNDQHTELTPIEFDLLQALISHHDEVLSKPYLYPLILSKPFSRYDRSLDMHVSNLRGKLSAIAPDKKLIKTVRGKGYCYR